MNETLTAPATETPHQPDEGFEAMADVLGSLPHSINREGNYITYEEYMQNRAKEQREKAEKTVIVVHPDGAPSIYESERSVHDQREELDNAPKAYIPFAPEPLEQHLAQEPFDQKATDEEFDRIINDNFARDHFGPNAFEKVDLVPREETKAEKVSHFWREHKQAVLNVFSGAYWATRWTMHRHDVMEHGITEDMSERRVQIQMEKNRRNDMLGRTARWGVSIAAVAGIAVAVGEAAHLIQAAQHIETQSLFDPSNHINHAGNFHGTVDPNAAPHAQHLHVPESAVAPAPITRPGFEATQAPPSWSDITPGEGGKQLFTNAHLSTIQWHDYANELLKLKGDFYEMPDGTVGIARVGRLSQNAQDFMESLSTSH